MQRTELITGLYENLAVMFLLDLLRGTPFLAWALQTLGARISQHCYLDTTWFTEFDLVDIGDDAALNDNANLQTHLFQDRVMATGPVRIGEGSVIGAMAVVLPDAEVERDALVGDLSLIMKGERIHAGTRWQGAPARLLGPARPPDAAPPVLP